MTKIFRIQLIEQKFQDNIKLFSNKHFQLNKSDLNNQNNNNGGFSLSNCKHLIIDEPSKFNIPKTKNKLNARYETCEITEDNSR